jgi:MFS family permease
LDTSEQGAVLTETAPGTSSASQSTPVPEPPVPELSQGYDRIFWLTYLSNALTTLANGMMVRYSDFVDARGGDEQQLGLIVGAGMIGSIAIRLAQGEAIDRIGAARVWFWSVVIYTVSLLLHLAVVSAYSPSAFFARALMQASLAGIFGSSITFVALRVPPKRMAEIVGALGTSGFLGLMLGPLLSDWLGSGHAVPDQMVFQMFLTATGLAAASSVATWFAIQGACVPVAHERPSLLSVMRRYHPLMISATAAVMGAGFAIPATFLRPFAIEKNLTSVGLFFVVYAMTGFGARVASRSLFERFGNRPWIVVGLILLTISYLCYVPVTRTWHLIVPASIAGVAHALLFPSIMSAGTAVFPRKYLGVATSLILAMFDIGTFISAPIIGTFLRIAKPLTPHAYPWMFASVASVFATVTVLFVFSHAGRTHQVVE